MIFEIIKHFINDMIHMTEGEKFVEYWWLWILLIILLLLTSWLLDRRKHTSERRD